MKVQIIGIQSQDYKLDNGYEFKGDKIHAVDMDTTASGLIGNVVMNFKIPAGSPMSSVPLQVGEFYTIYFNQKGGVDFLAPCNK